MLAPVEPAYYLINLSGHTDTTTEKNLFIHGIQTNISSSTFRSTTIMIRGRSVGEIPAIWTPSTSLKLNELSIGWISEASYKDKFGSFWLALC